MSKIVRMQSRRPIAVDFFCGAGGMTLGFEQAGFDIRLSVDSDGHSVATHARNFPRTKVLCRSVLDLAPEEVFDGLDGEREIDLVFGGPPCQGFSTMGLRDVLDPRNSLVARFADLVAELRPKAFVMENVPGLLAGDARAILDAVVGRFEVAGYRITKPLRTLDASAFGVPQKRTRLFILGVRGDIDRDIAYPGGPPASQPPRPTVWEAIADLPHVEKRKEFFANDSGPYDDSPRHSYAMVARGLCRDPSDYSYPRHWDRDLCSGCMRIRHIDSTLLLYAATPPGQIVPGHKLPRLNPDGICPTLRAGSDSSHGSHTAPRPIHPFQPRCITAREAARLHGFPDWFSFYPSKWHAYRQIGNAVCPPVARAIGYEILNVLSISPKKPATSVSLSESFDLPLDRPRSQRRIPHSHYFPPVVAFLFDKAFDARSGRLWRARFTFADVLEAIAATGARVNWLRADTFIPELARCRHPEQILAACVARGFSLRPVKDGDFIGEFVPVGTPGAITEKDIASVRSGEVATAIRVASPLLIPPLSLERLPYLLKNGRVARSLWCRDAIRIELELETDLFGVAGVTGYRMSENRKVVGSGRLLLADRGQIPNRLRIGRAARAACVPEVVSLVSLTARHVLASRFEDCLASPREAKRCIFELVGATRPVE